MTGIPLPDQLSPFKLGEPAFYPGPPCLPEQLADHVNRYTPVRPSLSETEWIAIGQAVQDPVFLRRLIAFSNYHLGCGETW